jgi:hypothetical protein
MHSRQPKETATQHHHPLHHVIFGFRVFSLQAAALPLTADALSLLIRAISCDEQDNYASNVPQKRSLRHAAIGTICAQSLLMVGTSH